MCELKEKPKEQGDAFLVDMMRVWSDDSLENFFRNEGIAIEKKPLPAENKPPVLEPTKKGLPSLKSLLAKKEVASKPNYHDRVFSFAGMSNSFLENGTGADFVKEIPHDVTHQGYNPG